MGMGKLSVVDTEASRRVRRFSRAVVVGVSGLMVAGSVVVATPGTACACSCAGSATPEEAVSDASGVFVARATEKVSDGFADIYEFEVSDVFKGDVGATTTVGTLAAGNGCGTRYEVGKEYLLFVSKPYEVDAAWEGYSCGHYTGSPFDIRAVTEQVYGAPHPPEDSAPLAVIGTGTQGTAVRATPVLAVAGVVLVGAMVWVGVILHRRRSGGARGR
ncbi:hypothetical protein M2280_000430 [Prescottella agglutinans]|uniref:Tissue inhibitor of metalloproteinase n=1 Tax=Prescottella agglutinans TaxID=1644129 RepID=A0ABT6M4J0_9NOCA|nr:hypothetical protein [Prescottella agglutinans]